MPPCNQLPALGTEDADGSIRAGNDVEHSVPEEWRGSDAKPEPTAAR